MRRPAPKLLLPISVFLVALAMGGQGPLRAQGSLVERIGRAEAPIYEDNLDAAKGRAILRAQREALQGVVRELIAEEWMTLFSSEVSRKVLARPERYIGSFRVENLQTSPDRTRYFATVAVRVDNNRLIRDLRDLSLPVRGDPERPILLFYAPDDPVLRVPAFREAVLEAVKGRMRLLNLAVKGAVALEPEELPLLANAFGDPLARGEFLSKHRIDGGWYLAFQLEPSAGGKAEAEFRAVLYQAGTGAQLGSFALESQLSVPGGVLQPSRDSGALLGRLVRPLLSQIQPRGIKPFGPAAGRPVQLKLRVLGLTSVEEEEEFERAFFHRDSAFRGFVLAGLEREAVTYEGEFGGVRKNLETDLPGQEFGDFRVARVFWFDSVLEIEVERATQPHFPEMRLFGPEVRQTHIAEIIETFLFENPELLELEPYFTEVEANGWLTRANAVPLGVTFHGFLDSRGDSDFFVAEELTHGQVIRLFWQRLGRTNLNPALRLYGERGQLVKTFFPRFRLRTTYTVPKGEHRFFIEVADRFGSLSGDTGGYLNFHYLLLAARQNEADALFKGLTRKQSRK